jgi:hypothetical protein
MEALREISYACPFCWETIETVVALSELPLETVEDCRVCCHPALIRVTLGADGEPELDAEAAT